MATSGNFDYSVGNGVTFRVRWELVSQSIENNSSNVAWYVQLITGASEYYLPGMNHLGISHNWTQYNVDGPNWYIAPWTTRTLWSATFTNYHDANGNSNFYTMPSSTTGACYYNEGWPYGTTFPSTGGTADIDRIPQESSFTTSGTTYAVGSYMEFYISRERSDFLHKLYYTLGGIVTGKQIGRAHV